MLTRLVHFSGPLLADGRATAQTSIPAWSAICALPRTSWGPLSAPSPVRKRRPAESSTRSSGCERVSIERAGRAPTAMAALPRPRQLARQRLERHEAKESRAELHKYFLEALRLQPQGEVLLRKCARDGARIGDSRPIAAGTLVFAAHGSAMKDLPEPDAFILDRPREHYLQHGWSRHTCLGQYVSPVIIVESMIALFGLQDLRRPEPRGRHVVSFERRFGRLQLDDQNLYATTFSLQFADLARRGTFWPGTSRRADIRGRWHAESCNRTSSCCLVVDRDRGSAPVTAAWQPRTGVNGGAASDGPSRARGAAQGRHERGASSRGSTGRP